MTGKGVAKIAIDPDIRTSAKDPYTDNGTILIEHPLPEDPEPNPPRVIAKGFHYAHNPETGLDAVFLDGEILPEWAWPESTELS